MESSQYQRLRLWTGITGITLNLALVWAAVFASPTIDACLFEWPLFFSLPLVLLGAQLIMLPFDFLTGHLLERTLDRTECSGNQWIADWAQVVVRQTLVMTAAGLMFAIERPDVWWVHLGLILLLGTIMTATAVCLLGIIPRDWIMPGPPDARFATAMSGELQRLKKGGVMVIWIRDLERTAVNGMALDFLRPRTVALSESVVRGLTPRQAALLVAREAHAVASGQRVASLAICIGWLLGGVAIGWNLPAAEGLQSALLPMAFITTWCLLALFVWPHLSRRWVIANDRWLATQCSPEETAELLRRVQALNATDTRLPQWKRRIFHPIPPLENRLNPISTAPTDSQL